MRIAICDDDSQEIGRVSSYIDQYREETSKIISYKTFQSAVELLSDVKINHYDLLLLDILMPGINGMQAAHELRTFNESVKIAFLTSSPEFAVESYAVKAYDYILKPVIKEKLYAMLDSVVAEAQEPLDGLTVKTRMGMARILYSRLAFVEVMNKKLYFNMTDGSIREVTSPLADFEEQLLLRPEFVKVHRSYIVNLWQVVELDAKELITLSGKHIPISRLMYGNVREAYMKHLFLEKGVV